MDPDAFIPIAAALAREGAEYVLVGGVAVNLQGLVRATQDVDLFIRPVEDNVECVRRALRSIFQDECIDEIRSEDLGGDYPVVRYGPPDVDYVIDIIGRIGEAWTFDDLEKEDMEIQGIRIPVATPRTLYRMKRDTIRPQDKIDAELLRVKFELEGD